MARWAIIPATRPASSASVGDDHATIPGTAVVRAGWYAVIDLSMLLAILADSRSGRRR